MRKLSVNTGMSRPPKATPQAKRVAPPAIPDVYRHSGSSFGSAGYVSSEDAVYLAPPDTPNSLNIRDDHSDYGSTISKSPGVLSNYIAPTAFPFPITRETLTHKAAVYYHQQLALQEDQGIDLTQSPGRDSPGSSSGSAGSGSRHSTASLDSGRASSYLTGTSTRGPLSSPRCSVSSCSIGSVDRMIQRNDHEIIVDWLIELHFDEYAQLFSVAGYDLPTIARMTPEDLTAIGIKNPNHRERIKQHIDGLQIPDSLPNYVPGSIEEWLRLLRLEEYAQPLLSQRYQSVRDVTQLTWEDLEDIGIVKLGHQKKICLAIKRVKDIISGKWVPPGIISSQPQSHYQLEHQHQHWSQQTPAQTEFLLQQQMHREMNFIHQQNGGNWDHQLMTQSAYNEIQTGFNDIVLIKLRQPRGKSLESLEDSTDRSERSSGTHLTFTRPNEYYNTMTSGQGQYIGANLQNMPWRRSYDDGDITPTNEIAIGCCEGGGTLPRQRCAIPRSRPIAKVQANLQQTPFINKEYNSATKCYGLHCASPLLGKKPPPEPPRRQCSASSVDQMSSHFDAVSLNHPVYHNHTAAYFSQHHPAQPLYANYAGQTHQTTVEIHAEKTHDSKSNSSIDSIDAIPFANENAGTIKQRAINRQDLTSSLSSSSSSSSSSATTIAGQQTLPIKLVTDSAQSTPSPTLSITPDKDTPNAVTNVKPMVDSNVLNDIGHMLANLTDELDAMLEEEKRAGLNDSD